jgi:hypothetical protein
MQRLALEKGWLTVQCESLLECACMQTEQGKSRFGVLSGCPKGSDK